MLFQEVARVYDDIEATAGRLEMRDMLATLFSGATCKEVSILSYLTLGRIYPEFIDVEFGLADRQVLKAIYEATRVDLSHLEALYQKIGDLGAVAMTVMLEKKQRSLFSEQLTVERLYRQLDELARKSGKGSQQAKTRILAGLFHSATPLEAKYIARIIMGRMRIGVAVMTILDALSVLYAGEERKEDVERAYYVCSDVGLVAEKLCKSGIAGLEEIRVEVGRPLKAMLAERLGDIEDIMQKMGGKAAFEYKYDGLRMQVHIDKTEDKGKKVRMFSRQLEDITHQFPELHAPVLEAFKGQKGIVEGECVPVDPATGEFLPFQVISRRRGRKHDLSEAIEEFPVRLILFDILLHEDEDMTLRPFPERRKRLESCIGPNDAVSLSNILITFDPGEAEHFFMQSLADGCEGLMAKSLADNSVYRAGARGWLWIKYKKEYRSEMSDTVDLVPVGAFAGRGKRAGKYGALLMAAYNPEREMFETVCKLGSGFSDADLEDLVRRFEHDLLKIRSKRVDSMMEADYWFEPRHVLEVLGAEITLSPNHTCGFGKVREGAGLAIRFPRFTGRWREDKGPEDATTTGEILDMYGLQLKKVEG